jgi:adenosine deaminase
VQNRRTTMPLRDLPKVELHRHLEGAMRPATLLDLGRARGLDLPLSNVESLAPEISWSEGEPRSLAHFLTKFRSDWYASYRDVERVASEAVRDALEQGIVHLELRFSPEHYARSNGLDPLGTMQSVVEAGRAMAEDNDLGLRFLVTFARERHDHQAWSRIIDRAAELSELGLVGVDLAGDEFKHPNQGFERIMTRAKDTGVLGVTIHAGEGTSADQVRSAVEQLHADRIGHGISAIQDPKVVAMLAESTVCLEMCPISNYQTGCIDSLADHPLPALDRQGVRVTLNSDDPTIHRSSLNDDYRVAMEELGCSLHDLLRFERNAIQAAFLDDESKRSLTERIEIGYAPHLDQNRE